MLWPTVSSKNKSLSDTKACKGVCPSWLHVCIQPYSEVEIARGQARAMEKMRQVDLRFPHLRTNYAQYKKHCSDQTPLPTAASIWVSRTAHVAMVPGERTWQAMKETDGLNPEGIGNKGVKPYLGVTDGVIAFEKNKLIVLAGHESQQAMSESQGQGTDFVKQKSGSKGIYPVAASPQQRGQLLLWSRKKCAPEHKSTPNVFGQISATDLQRACLIRARASSR